MWEKKKSKNVDPPVEQIEKKRFSGRKSRRMFQLGDSIKVKILKVDILRNQIDLEVNEDSDDIVIDLATVFYDVENGTNLPLSYNEDVNAMSASLVC